MFRTISSIACAALASVSMSAYAAYPEKPIRMIIPLAAGSSVDNAARILADKMAANMGATIVVENQPGASGSIGAARLAKAAPDGYTIGGFNDSTIVRYNVFYNNGHHGIRLRPRL